MKYLEITVRCRHTAAEAVADELATRFGGVAIYDPRAIIQARAEGRWDVDAIGDPGEPDWVTVKAYHPVPETATAFQTPAGLPAALGKLQQLEPGLIAPPDYRWVDDEDWAEAWKKYYQPLAIGARLIVVPSWEQATFTVPAGRQALLMDPGMAFGTGQHASTALCLAWLQELPMQTARILDVGTGSGILAIGAALLGASAVLAIDIDPVAVAAAADNCSRNMVTAQVTVVMADPRHKLAADFSRAGLTGITANLTADLIAAMATDFYTLLSPGGLLLASGIVSGREDMVRAALTAAGLRPEAARDLDGWTAILARRP